MKTLSELFKFTRIDAHYKSHINPDGSVGGLVAQGANVDPSAVVEPFSVVQPDVKIGAGEKVRRGDFVLSSGITLRFD